MAAGRYTIAMNVKPYAVVLEFDPSHRGAYKWSAWCPALPGCVSDGRTRAEAKRNMREALRGFQEAASRARLSSGRRVEVVEVVA